MRYEEDNDEMSWYRGRCSIIKLHKNGNWPKQDHKRKIMKQDDIEEDEELLSYIRMETDQN